MADIIQLLPDHVANQIAAGEVVQRPASVVKELLENAIDAGSDHITLLVKDAGKTLIQVTDNGCGMSPTDARLSFERHATSKIKSAEDLFQLNTKGFRGEALASIAAIAQVTLKTRTSKLEVGTEIAISGSEVLHQEATVTPIGTTIAVKNLFYNIPARRNFLKSNAVETRHIIDEFHRVALSHPQVAFKMIHNGSDVFNLPVSNVRQRIVNIFGNKTNEKLVPVSEETEIVKVEGYVMKPSFARKSRGEQFFFVNDRFIKSTYLHHAVVNAFEGLIKDGTHPGYFLFLTLPPAAIDINIHPTKTEVKFEEEYAIYTMLRATIKHSLGQFSVAPVLDFNKDSGFETPYEYSKKAPQQPHVSVDRNFNPFHTDTATKAAPRFKKQEKGWESLYIGLNDDSASETLTTSEDWNTSKQITVESDPETGQLFPQEEETVQTTFQIQNKYIVSPIKSGLMVIHQHLAHQRVLYEELLKNITVQEATSQQLLFPIALELTKKQWAVLEPLEEALLHTGFIFEKQDGDGMAISGIPVGISESNVAPILQRLADDLLAEVPDAGFSLNDVLAKSLARSMAVRTGTPLNKEAREHLIHQLFACKEPSVSPENKPVLITLEGTDLDAKFM
ncbi:DNA mismatch repair endonuclease MutL [Altibacter sp. HG106]|uniref:DNA mismatch repair endonuclease MutL n=1 Tax=Altibacter sp. HG106 TaxID=3023937 RepID=UPI00235009A8|nr:DNA mismatch repair endonuclease MutL [Altibacter sp. HG106]MDC7995548.1 DNA mismatch repair endonuclease MutL [Altibacter sp. HG106]